MRARSLPESPGQALPGKISAGIPDSLAPELLQLLTSEFWNVESGTPSSFREATHSAKAPSVRGKEHSCSSEVAGVQELQNQTAAFRSVEVINRPRCDEESR
jgi:hypothetical protein